MSEMAKHSDAPYAAKKLQEHPVRANPADASGNIVNDFQQQWFQDLQNIRALSKSVPEQFQYRQDADINYFGELKTRADELVKQKSENFNDLLGKQSLQQVQDIYSRMHTLVNELDGPSDFSSMHQMHALLLMLLWKSAIVESRGSKFIVGVTVRYLERNLSDILETFETNETGISSASYPSHSEMSYKAWSVLATVKNTQAKYGNRGDAHADMETVIAETLTALLQSAVYGGEVKALMEEEVFQHQGTLGDRQKRYNSEVLFMFLKVEGDLFTAIEGGSFAMSIKQREERENWIKVMKRESDAVIKEYKVDRDGRYYRRFGWRSVIVYFGTLGALIIAAVASALDLGNEGSNVFKRLNFFATLAVSIDLLVLGLFKIFDRNDKAVTDGLYFKHRVKEISKEYNAKQYKMWRKAIAFNASKVAGAVSPTNTCYASQTMTGDIISREKMQFDEIVDMFYIIEHGYHKNGIKMLNIKTGKQYNLVNATQESSHIEPAPSYGIAYTGMVRKVSKSDGIDNLGASVNARNLVGQPVR